MLGNCKRTSISSQGVEAQNCSQDIKATNVLLGKDLNAKILDFGLTKLDDEENSHISTRKAATM